MALKACVCSRRTQVDISERTCWPTRRPAKGHPPDLSFTSIPGAPKPPRDHKISYASSRQPDSQTAGQPALRSRRCNFTSRRRPSVTLLPASLWPTACIQPPARGCNDWTIKIAIDTATPNDDPDLHGPVRLSKWAYQWCCACLVGQGDWLACTRNCRRAWLQNAIFRIPAYLQFPRFQYGIRSFVSTLGLRRDVEILAEKGGM